jgi:predicted secreted hydrolase
MLHKAKLVHYFAGDWQFSKRKGAVIRDRAFIKGIVRIGIWIFCALLTSCLSEIVAAQNYPSISGPCRFDFPRDHGSHPDYRIEWWYYTGNLRSEDGGQFGFQLTFFRVRTAPAATDTTWPEKPSAWRTSQVFAAHAALSDISHTRFYHAERMSRSALGLAGTREGGGGFEVFVDGWKADIKPSVHQLLAKGPDFSFDLELTPEKKPVPHGDSGYSRKGEEPDEASCYYSIPRLAVAGKAVIDGREKTVSGTAWMDHEFSSSPLNPKLAGWDWFSLQFQDGSDLMIYLMREKSGRVSPVTSGTFVDKDGKTVHLSAGDFRITTLSSWKSSHSGAIYPSTRILEVFPINLRVTIVPNMEDQEMQSPDTTHVTYWEGSVRANGSGPGGRPVSGAGYAELTGYAGSEGAGLDY